MNPKLMASQVEACAPVKGRNYRRITMGWEYLILEVNGDYIFRFPKFRGSWTRLNKEILLLSSLSDRISVPVPDYEFIWRGDKKHPHRFAGYKKVRGIPCTERNFRRVWSESLGEDLGRFLTELHGLRPSPKVLRNLQKYTPKTWAENSCKFYRRVRRYTYPLLSKGTRAQADVFWNGLLSDLDRADFESSFIHGDLTGGNIIFDPANGRLTGVIDWGDAQVADPALDFVGAFQVNGRLGQRAMSSYRRDKSGFMERIELYLKTIPFGEIIWGVTQESSYHTRLGLRHLRRWFPRRGALPRATLRAPEGTA